MSFKNIIKSSKLNAFELSAIFFVIFSIIILGLGSIVFTEIIWDGFVYPNVWEPVIGDATDGDSPYNTQNTLLFAILLFTFVIALSGIFRVYNLPARADTIFALLPWVILAASIRVLEDAEFGGAVAAVLPLHLSQIGKSIPI